MTSLSATVHLLGALRRAAGRVLLTFFLTLIVVGGATEAVSYFVSGQAPTILTHILAAVLAVGWAIALSLLVLVGEVIRGLVTGVKDTVKDVEKEAAGVGQFVSSVASSVEHHDKK